MVNGKWGMVGPLRFNRLPFTVRHLPNSKESTMAVRNRSKPVTGTFAEMARKLPAAQRPMMDPVGTPGVASPDELRILLPEPHALLHAHNKGSWHAKSGIVKLLRWKAQQRCLGCNAASWPAATILYKFWLPETSGMRDEANLIDSASQSTWLWKETLPWGHRTSTEIPTFTGGAPLPVGSFQSSVRRNRSLLTTVH